MSKCNKAIKYRIYPTKEQIDFFIRNFGCCRKVWNLMLADRETAYKENKTIYKPTPAAYKEGHPYLREADSLALANVQLQLEAAYNRFFSKSAGHPKFKSKKRSKKSYTTNKVGNNLYIDPDRGIIHLPKVKNVKAGFHRLPQPDWVLKSCTVSMSGSGRFYCSCLFEFEQDVPKAPVNSAIGFDYKSDGFYTDSDGNICGSPKYFRKAQKQLAHAQRQLRHKKKDSNNYQKTQRKIASIHEHIANQRNDFLQKLSTEIANQYDLVAVEDLNMKAMSNKGFRNGKATMDNGWGRFVNMLEYKLADRGKILIKVDKWYPSSQLCSCCGYQDPLVKDLSVRRWTCPECGAVHDRDHNAAINIRNEGLRIYAN